MSQRTRRAALLGALLLLGLHGAHAQVITYTWTGRNGDENWDTPANWLGNAVPADDLVNTRILFNRATGGQRANYSPRGSILVNQVSFQGILRPVTLYGPWDTANIGAGGIIYNPAAPVASRIFDAINLRASQLWNIQGGTLSVAGPLDDDYFDGMTTITNDFLLEKTGAGMLVFEHTSSQWSGGFRLTAGRVGVFPDFVFINDPELGFIPVPTFSQALGTGTLTFNGGTLVGLGDGSGSGSGFPVILANNVISHGLISTVNHTSVQLGYDDEGFSTIDLTTNTSVQTRGEPLYLSGRIIESGGTGRSLSLDTRSTLVLAGFNNYTGGTIANLGRIIFHYHDSIPATGLLKAGPEGYIGRMFDPTGATLPFATYLNRFDKPNTSGSIGVDSNLLGDAFDTYTEAINLTGFHADARLGSATQAVVTGAITPQGATSAPYRFGGGGGTLIVSSQLNDATRGVVADSPPLAPLTLGLGSLDTMLQTPLNHPGNAFAGGVSAKYSAVIFGPGALPASGSFTLLDGGYIGTAYTDSMTGEITNVAAFIGRFPTTTNKGVIGFDFFGDGSALVSSPINLGAITGPVYLGTATGAQISGTITTTNAGADPYRFAAYKDGSLDVLSTLDGVRGVVVGDPTSPATFGDYFAQEHSTVRILGNNSYTGGTTLYGGELIVGQVNGAVGTDPTNALGTGPLTVNPMSFPTGLGDILPDQALPIPFLDVVFNQTIIPNAIVLNTSLDLAGDSSLTLAGAITGTGGLLYEGYGTLSLTGSNTFSGGLRLGEYPEIRVGTDTALGSGPVKWGDYDGAYLYFETAAPVVGGLDASTYADLSYLYAEAPNTVITVNQATDGRFTGDVRSNDVTDAIRFVKNGPGRLVLDDGGLYYHNGVAGTGLPGDPQVSLQVNQGAVFISDSFYIEDSVPSFWINGGTLALDRSQYVDNPLIISSGRLAGHGRFGAATIGAGAIIAPGIDGFGEVGSLGFDDLTLQGGGLYEWNLIAADPLAVGGADRIDVFNAPTLTVESTSANPFTLKLISLLPDGTPGMVSGFTGSRSYSYKLFQSVSLAGFDPSKFVIDATQFFTDLPIHTLTLSQSGNDILLTIQHVPEPSTYALMALGLGAVWLAHRRRSRRAGDHRRP